ncbi:RICIN domain-containing protein [Luedemannella flava]
MRAATRSRRGPLLTALAGVALLGAAVGGYALLRTTAGPDFVSTLVALHSEKCLTAPGGAHADGVDLNQQACADSATQRFSFTRLGGGSYEIRNESTGACVDIAHGRTDNGTPLTQAAACGRTPSQEFGLQAVPDFPRAFMLVSRYSGKCADVYAGGDADGAGVLQWDCGDPASAGNQIWRLAGAPASTPSPSWLGTTPGGSSAAPSGTPSPSGAPVASPPATPSAPASGGATVATNPLWGKALPPSGAKFSRAYALITGVKDKGYQPRSGECSWQIHARYWEYGPDGKVYPTWHPPRHSSGCSFGHEHGHDPRTADLWRQTGWFPFGYTNEQLAPSDPAKQRDEDHVGHKVSVGNNIAAKESRDGATVKTCDVLMKFHQGTHSPDALTNNLHELLFHGTCKYKDNGAVTEARYNVLLPLGHPGGFTVNRDCDADQREIKNVGPVTPSNSPDGGGFTGRFIPDSVCAADVLDGSKDIGDMSEIWTMASFARNQGKLAQFELFTIAFVANPSRFFDPDSANKIRRPIDLCYSGAEGRLCDLVRRTTERTGKKIAFDSPSSPFNGAFRVISPTRFVVRNTGPTTIYTNVFGTRFSTSTFPGAIKQYLSGNHAADRASIDVPFRNFAQNSADKIHAPN